LGEAAVRPEALAQWAGAARPQKVRAVHRPAAQWPALPQLAAWRRHHLHHPRRHNST
jgi:hypothetical protein